MRLFFLFSLFFTLGYIQAQHKHPAKKEKVNADSSGGKEEFESREVFSILRGTSRASIVVLYDNPKVNSYGVEIKDAGGQVIYHQSYSQPRSSVIEEVDLSDAAPGLYIIQIITPDKDIKKQIVLK